jgi:hypothetical protein
LVDLWRFDGQAVKDNLKETRKLAFVFKESISPEASTVMNRVKSPSVAAAEI